MESSERLHVGQQSSSGTSNGGSSSGSTGQQHRQLIPLSMPGNSSQRVPLHVHHSQINGTNSHGHLSFERKSLLAATSATVIGFILMLVAVTTDYWLIVSNPNGAYIHHDRVYRMYSHSGIFRICEITFREGNRTHDIQLNKCRHHILFPSDEDATKYKHDFDPTSLDYTRSEVAFSTLGMLLMLIGQGFAFCSFDENRYLCKRITATLHIVSATCILICIEVLVSSVTYEQAHLPARHPKNSLHHFGFSFVLACVTCAAFFIAGIIFGIFSRRRKAAKVQTEMKTFQEDDSEQPPGLMSVHTPLNA